MIAQAMEDIETIDSRFLENVINDVLLPKLIAIGFPVKPGLKFQFKNDKEKQEIRDRKDVSNGKTAAYILQLANAGFKPDAKWLSKFMEVPLVEQEAPEITKDVLNKLNKTYSKI
jgi:hypothetical protein